MLEKTADLESSLQKQASTPIKSDASNCKRIEEVVDNIVKAGFLDKSASKAAIEAIRKNPDAAPLEFLDKLATLSLDQRASSKTVDSLGKSVESPRTPSKDGSRDSDIFWADKFSK